MTVKYAKQHSQKYVNWTLLETTVAMVNDKVISYFHD